MNSIFIWIGNPNNCLRLNTLPQALLCFENLRAFFEKALFWGPQAMFAAEQAAAGIFFEKRHAFVRKGLF